MELSGDSVICDVILSITTPPVVKTHFGAGAVEVVCFSLFPSAFVFAFALCEVFRKPVMFRISLCRPAAAPAIYSIAFATMIHLFKLPRSSREAGCPYKRSVPTSHHRMTRAHPHDVPAPRTSSSCGASSTTSLPAGVRP